MDILDLPVRREIVDLRIKRIIAVLDADTHAFLAAEMRLVADQLETLRADMIETLVAGRDDIESALEDYVQDALKGRVKNGFRSLVGDSEN